MVSPCPSPHVSRPFFPPEKMQLKIDMNSNFRFLVAYLQEKTSSWDFKRSSRGEKTNILSSTNVTWDFRKSSRGENIMITKNKWENDAHRIFILQMDFTAGWERFYYSVLGSKIPIPYRPRWVDVQWCGLWFLVKGNEWFTFNFGSNAEVATKAHTGR